ncbi:MAG TPA: FHA domain-containing protein [bacterium]|nr:FHA domain-containing protein [bacterium]
MSGGFGFDPIPSNNASTSDGGLTPENAALRIVNGPAAGRIFPLSRMRTLIGRNDPPSISVDIDLEPCELAPPPFMISRRHAEIQWADGVLTLCDLGSMNGTYVNDMRIVPQSDDSDNDGHRTPSDLVALKVGDRIRFANIETEVVADDKC